MPACIDCWLNKLSSASEHESDVRFSLKCRHTRSLLASNISRLGCLVLKVQTDAIALTNVSRLGLVVVRRWAGKRKDAGSTPQFGLT